MPIRLGLIGGLVFAFVASAWAAGKDQLTQEQALGVAMTANAAEVNYGTLMAARATDPEVREYAQRLMTEHGQSNEQMLKMMKEQNLRPANSPVREKITGEAMKQLGNLWTAEAGPELDKRYMTNMVADHREDLDALDTKLIPAAQTPEVQRALGALRETVAAHLQAACTIGQRVGADTKGCPAQGTK